MIKKIEYISVDVIHPHPDNPRKDLGDLTELADSIKKNGVLQNLTVVPKLDGYTVIIGHRRLAASKLAGLKEVPCVIADMDERTQVSTMLIENIQRNGLNMYEQAKSFGQLVFDFGMKTEDVCAVTGFSSQTIKNRIKLLELNEREFEQSALRGATMSDYIKIQKIEDVTERNEVLKACGTSDFNWKYQAAMQKQETKAIYDEWMSLFDKFGKVSDEAPDYINYSHRRYISLGKKPDESIIKELESIKAESSDIRFYKSNFGCSVFVRKSVEEVVEAKESEIRRKETEAALQKAKDELTKDVDISIKLMLDFIMDYKVCDKHIPLIIREYSNAILASFSIADLERKIKSIKNIDCDQYLEKYPFKYMLLAALAKVVKGFTYPFNCVGEFYENSEYSKLCAFLEKLGYELNSVEKSLIDGTHESYMGEKK